MKRREVLVGMSACAAGMVVGTCAEAGGTGPRVRPDLYACEGCEAVAERAPDSMTSRVQLASATEPGERMVLTGRVLNPRTRAPVAGVIVYAHHTNARGLYANGGKETTWSRRHGRLRGWARTGQDGVYTFDTIKPAPYPDGSMPAHVHLFLGEPGRAPYYVDDAVFDGEYGVTTEYRAKQELRGGSGILKPSRSPAGVWFATRDIVLEQHP